MPVKLEDIEHLRLLDKNQFGHSNNPVPIEYAEIIESNNRLAHLFYVAGRFTNDSGTHFVVCSGERIPETGELYATHPKPIRNLEFYKPIAKI